MMTKVVDKKFTVSIDGGLAAEVERFVSEHPTTTKSAVFEDALRLWHRERLKQQRESYYDSITSSEVEEDRAWSALAKKAAKAW